MFRDKPYRPHDLFDHEAASGDSMPLTHDLYRETLRWKWVLNSHFGPRVRSRIDPKATVIIPSYHGRRARNVAPIVRSALKYDGTERVIVSNNNPRIRIEDWVEVRDRRVTLINQPVRRGCGYAWTIAAGEEAEFFAIIDDDRLVYPQQLAVLVERLVEQPACPHGLVGAFADGTRVQRQEAEVAWLYSIYAVTKAHVRRYHDYVAEIRAGNYAADDSIEFWGDDIIISQSGTQRPRIHDVGPLIRCSTWNAPGVATWREPEFEKRREEVSRAVERVRAGVFAQPGQAPGD
jgi:hypothetical protein